LGLHEIRYISPLQNLSSNPEIRENDRILLKAEVDLNLSFPYLLADLHEIWRK
jgi:hypothetical protein